MFSSATSAVKIKNMYSSFPIKPTGLLKDKDRQKAKKADYADRRQVGGQRVGPS